MISTLILPLLFAWNVGPAPGAQELSPGLSVMAEGSFIAGNGVQGGLGATVGYTPHPRAHLSLSLQQGTAFDQCPDCGAPFVATLSLRATAVRHRSFNLAPWVTGSAVGSTLDYTAGIAAEGGIGRLRLDASWPLSSSHELLATLRIVPEHGLSWAWSKRHATRFAVVGLEPGFALQHRVVLDRFTLEATARHGEEGFGLQASVALHAF